MAVAVGASEEGLNSFDGVGAQAVLVGDAVPGGKKGEHFPRFPLEGRGSLVGEHSWPGAAAESYDGDVECEVPERSCRYSPRGCAAARSGPGEPWTAAPQMTFEASRVTRPLCPGFVLPEEERAEVPRLAAAP